MDVLSTWINPLWLDGKQRARFQKSFSGRKPYSHGVLPSFLIESKARALLAALKEETFTYKNSDLFSLNQTADFSSVKNELLRSFYVLASSKEFAVFMHEITGLEVKPGALDLAGSLYLSGDYLLCHDDQVEDRKIAYVLYLSEGFGERDGAEFIVFNNEHKRPTTIAHVYPPEWNTLMLFEVGPLSYHMVGENCSSKKRYAIGGWLH